MILKYIIINLNLILISAIQKKILIPTGAVRKTLVDREPLSLVDVLPLNDFKSNYMYMIC